MRNKQISEYTVDNELISHCQRKMLQERVKARMKSAG